MKPMLRGKIEEGQKLALVFEQALNGSWILLLKIGCEGFHELFGFGLAVRAYNISQHLLGLGLSLLG